MGETINNIKAILDQIRPFLQRDGGDIEFVEYIKDKKTVVVKLQGAQMTLKGVVENVMKEALPEDVQYVEAVAF